VEKGLGSADLGGLCLRSGVLVDLRNDVGYSSTGDGLRALTAAGGGVGSPDISGNGYLSIVMESSSWDLDTVNVVLLHLKNP
jgi:hypothetical protein